MIFIVDIIWLFVMLRILAYLVFLIPLRQRRCDNKVGRFAFKVL